MKKQQLMRNFSIGIFDSGFGGLHIMREIVKELPEYSYIYLGDTARTPYGTRSQETVYNFTKQAVEFLLGQKCWLIVLACNTISSEALRKIQKEYLTSHYPKRRVLGVLIPAAELAVGETDNNRVGVIATEGSVGSGAFEREVKKLDPKIRVFQKSCPLLMPIVEAGEQNSEIVEIVLKKYLAPLVKKNIDTLILGCTHYGLLEGKIKNVLGSKIKVIGEGKIVAKKLKDYLLKHPEIERNLNKNSRRTFFTTDLTDRFRLLGSKFFGRPIVPEKIKLE